MKSKPTENQVAQGILDWLRLQGWRVHRLEADITGPKTRAKREEVGTPDYLCIFMTVYNLRFALPGCAINSPRPLFEVFYLETKRPGAKLRVSQRIWIDDARKRGWRVCVASSVEDVQQFLEGG